MFRFTIRDVLWLMVVAALVCMWWMELGKSSRMSREREEAIAKWHHASQQWVEATKLIPPQKSGGGMGGGGVIGGGGLGGRAPDAASAAADDGGDNDEKENSEK